MRIKHRIVIFQNNKYFERFRKELDDISFEYKFIGNGSISIIEASFYEEEACSKRLKKIADKYKVDVQTGLEYSIEEILQSEWVIVNVGQYQYPQPLDIYQEVTYDLSSYCPRCGIGRIQNRPFVIKKEFTQKRAKFLGLHWVFDEIFVRPDICYLLITENVTGVSFTDVLQEKNKAPLQNTVQMKILTIAPAGMITRKLFKVTCKPNNEESGIKSRNISDENGPSSYCGRVKYHWPIEEPISFSEKALRDLPDIIKSNEYFGSGAAANRFILMRHRVVKMLFDKKINGLEFQRPVILV